MASNRRAAAGESQIKLFELGSNYNKDGISPKGIEFDYYESILDNSVRATITIVDTGHREGEDGTSVYEEEDINLTSGEPVGLKVSDANQNILDLTGDKKLRVKEVRNLDESTNKIIFTFDLCSEESINNELEKCRVKTRFDGKISDSIEKILKEVLKTSKDLDIDDTLNELSFIGNVEKPFYKCTWLGPRSVPDIKGSKSNLAGFFFYETYEGFKFKSIDKLFQQKPKKKYIFNNIIEETPPPTYDGKILDYSFDSSIDLKKTLITGSLGQSKVKVVNSYESAFRQNDFNSEKQYNEDNTGGKERPRIASDLKLQDETTRISYKWDDQGFLVKGDELKDQLKRSTYINYSNDEILRQSYMRYNNLFSIKLSIAIAGDLSLRAGDLIECDFPEISSKKTKKVSKKKSGIYMISDVCHRITKNSCYTRLNLVRESISKK
jgi:hypothetical protein